MKKIAILTHSVGCNFGANLQALSTGAFLRNHGVQPYYICWSDYLTKNTSEQAQIHRTFIKRMGFEMSEPCSSYEEMSNYLDCNHIHNIIVGSDCVLTYNRRLFNYILTKKGFIKLPPLSKDHSFPNPFWLPFLKDREDIKRFLMSASSGTSNYHLIKKQELIEMRELLKKFSYLSVRDDYTLKMARYILGKDVDVHLTPDPVFGFNDNVTEQLDSFAIKKKFNLPDNYIVISFYGNYWPVQEWADKFCAAAHKHNLKVVSLLMPLDKRLSKFDLDVDGQLDPMEWYAIIKNSKGYVGNNMHPIIVSIHNCLPFFSFNIHGEHYFNGHIQVIKNSKETSLLSMGNLQDYQIAQKRYKHTTPEEIINRMITFRLDNCKSLSKKLNDDYHIMMNTILSQLIE